MFKDNNGVDQADRVKIKDTTENGKHEQKKDGTKQNSKKFYKHDK